MPARDGTQRTEEIQHCHSANKDNNCLSTIIHRDGHYLGQRGHLLPGFKLLRYGMRTPYPSKRGEIGEIADPVENADSIENRGLDCCENREIDRGVQLLVRW